MYGGPTSLDTNPQLQRNVKPLFDEELESAIQSGNFERVVNASKKMALHYPILALHEDTTTDERLHSVNLQGEQAIREMEANISALKLAVGSLAPRRELSVFVRGPPTRSVDSVSVTERSTSAKVYHQANVVLPSSPPPHLPQAAANRHRLVEACQKYMTELNDSLCREDDIGPSSRAHLARSGCQVIREACQALLTSSDRAAEPVTVSPRAATTFAHTSHLNRIQDMLGRWGGRDQSYLLSLKAAIETHKYEALADLALDSEEMMNGARADSEALRRLSQELAAERDNNARANGALKDAAEHFKEQLSMANLRTDHLQLALLKSQSELASAPKPFANYEGYSAVMSAAEDVVGAGAQALREALRDEDPLALAVLCIELLRVPVKEEDDNWEVVADGEKKIVSLRELLQTVRLERDSAKESLSRLDNKHRTQERAYADLLMSFNEVNEHLKEAYRSKEADIDTLRRAHRHEIDDAVAKYQELINKAHSDSRLLIDKEKATIRDLLLQLQLLSH